MLRSITLRYAGVLLSLGLSVHALYPAPAYAADQTGWQKRMQELYRVLAELLPDVVSDERFNSPKHRKDIEANAKKLADLSHGLKLSTAKGQGAISPDLDLSVSMIGSLFERETRRAYLELKRGHRAYARSLLRTIPGFCIGCHTRSSGGPDLSRVSSMEPPKTFASKLERAEFLAATRQFDKALDSFEEIVSDPRIAEGRQLEWERAARHALAIAVRVKRDPARALSLVEKIIASPLSPRFLKEDALQWKTSIQQWQEELPRQPQTEDGLYAEAVRLMGLAHTQQKYPADRSADILYLRASAVIHDLLGRAPQGIHVPEALMLLGVSYEALRDLDLWSLHEMYFVACIEKAPHTQIAETCYRRYEEATYSGYSGSGGISLPEEIKGQLQHLRKLAQPEEKAVP